MVRCRAEAVEGTHWLRQAVLSPSWRARWGNPCRRAALLSLCLGIRAKVGPASRVFQPTGDPKGRPVEYDPTPMLASTTRAPMLPGAAGTHALNEAARLLATFPLLPAERAAALVKAARTYQDAVWIAESEPELTWLFLVASIETVATHWISVDEEPVQLLRDAKPELADELARLGGAVLQAVALDLAGMIGAPPDNLQSPVQCSAWRHPIPPARCVFHHIGKPHGTPRPKFPSAWRRTCKVVLGSKETTPCACMFLNTSSVDRYSTGGSL